MNRSLNKVVVTGNSGFIGRQLERRLKLQGVAVTGLSRSCGFNILRDDLPLSHVDYVYHVAGLTYVPNAWSDPTSFYATNALGTVRVLDQCRRARVPLTFLSAYVYGIPTALPISEKMRPEPNNPYAFSKLAGEEACRFFAMTYKMKVNVLRLFNVYGPGQSATFLIPMIARQVLDVNVDEIIVADLLPRRDYVHVDDVVDALLLAPDLPSGSTFNVGSGRSRSVRDVITACLDLAGVAKPFSARNKIREGEILDTVADISAIQIACGWHPRTSFENGIKSVLENITL